MNSLKMNILIVIRCYWTKTLYCKKDIAFIHCQETYTPIIKIINFIKVILCLFTKGTNIYLNYDCKKMKWFFYCGVYALDCKLDHRLNLSVIIVLTLFYRYHNSSCFTIIDNSKNITHVTKLWIHLHSFTNCFNFDAEFAFNWGFIVN